MAGSEYTIKLTSVKLVGGDYKVITNESNGIIEQKFTIKGTGSSGGENKPSSNITSSKYKINNGYISRISPNATIQILKSNLSYEGTIIIKDKNGKEVQNNSTCATGMIADVNGGTYTLVVTGDIDGNAKISTNDLAKLRLNYIGKEVLDGARKEAADIDGNGKFSLNDIAKLKLVIVGKDSL